MIWKTSEKRMKQKYKIQWKDTQQTRTESQILQMKWKLKEKNRRTISQTTQDL
jgi:hypothetical protein